MKREDFDVARCTVARLMKTQGLRGLIRGRPVRTTVSDKAASCPLDLVNRQFWASRSNVLWLSDFTYVATWQGVVHVAFVIDALEQPLHDQKPMQSGGLVHHSDRGVKYVSIKYNERLADAGIDPSVGSVGDSYDNALAETINGLYNANSFTGADLGARSRRLSSRPSTG